MKIHLIGLGKMGSNLARNLHSHKHDVRGFDLDSNQRLSLEKDGIKTYDNLKDLLTRTNKERLVVWLMVPNHIVDNVISDISPYLREKDIIIDGGNSNFNKSVERYHRLNELEIEFVDVGTSGGTYGARFGACLMVGGSKDTFDYLKDVYKDISLDKGYGYMGGPGAGHFTKMVHNGIEYGMMQAIGEGFELIEKSPFKVDYKMLSEVWNNGSIIASNLIDFAAKAFNKDAKLERLLGRIDDSGEGKWMVETALDYEVALPVIAGSLFTRYKSRDDDKFSERVVAALRREFGGHAIYKKK